MHRFLGIVAVVLLGLSAGACSAGMGRKQATTPSYAYGSPTVDTGTVARYRQAEAAPGAMEDIVVADASERTYEEGDETGGGGGGTAGPVAQPLPGAKAEEAMVVEGWVRVQVDDVAKAAEALRAEVATERGKIIAEQVDGTGDGAWNGQIRVRLPPEQVLPFLDWLEQNGDIDSRRLTATDVSKTLVDDAIALENLELTLRRLQDLVGREGIAMQEVLALEREMERVRGEIERIKGEQRYLSDRVAYATLDVQLTRQHDAVLGGPQAKFHPGPRGSVLMLTSPGADREKFRAGFGMTLHFDRAFTLDMDFFPEPKGTTEGTTVLITAGGAAYSDFLGRGRRKFGNPYLGMRLGYGHTPDNSSFVIAGDMGLEIYKQKYVMIEAYARALGMIDGDGADGALQLGGAVVVAF